MRYSEIQDPKGLCKDVTNLGRWGNGDVEIGLSTLEELPYVMGASQGWGGCNFQPISMGF